MKTPIFTLILICFPYLCIAQDYEEELISLSHIFHLYHANAPKSDTVFQTIDGIKSGKLERAKYFIKELIKPQNDILSDKYLKKPDLPTLKALYAIKIVNWNLFQSNPIHNRQILDSLNSLSLNKGELLLNYYELVFGLLVNKHEEINFAERDFRLNNLNLRTQQEKGIFFLVSMECMNKVNGIEYEDIYATYDGKHFTSFNKFTFDDFNFTQSKEHLNISFKSYYLKELLKSLNYYLRKMDEAIARHSNLKESDDLSGYKNVIKERKALRKYKRRIEKRLSIKT